MKNTNEIHISKYERKKEWRVKYVIRIWKKERKKEKWNVWLKYERKKERKESEMYD